MGLALYGALAQPTIYQLNDHASGNADADLSKGTQVWTANTLLDLGQVLSSSSDDSKCTKQQPIALAYTQVPCNDNPTRFFFLYALPALSISFFVFGVFPIICDRLGLVVGTHTLSAAITQDPLVKRTRIPATTEAA